MRPLLIVKKIPGKQEISKPKIFREISRLDFPGGNISRHVFSRITFDVFYANKFFSEVYDQLIINKKNVHTLATLPTRPIFVGFRSTVLGSNFGIINNLLML